MSAFSPFPESASWLAGSGEPGEIVVSSRARLARNLAGRRFPAKAPLEEQAQVLEACREGIERAVRPAPGQRLAWMTLHDCPASTRRLLVERHVISQQHARGRQIENGARADQPRGVAILLPDERLSIMVNEEDHLRMQVIRPGLGLRAGFEELDAVDDGIEAALDYAFSPRFGYLCACPTNVGTGARFSVMLHLPALRITGELEKVKRAAKDMSLAVRGFFGEGSEAAGDFYQISNQTTLGKSEAVLLHELEAEIVPRVVDYERTARDLLTSKRRAQLEDQVFRALGLLSHARLLSNEEAMQLLSHVRLGVATGIITSVDAYSVNQLMLLIHPGHLQRAIGQELDQDQRRAARATLIRTRLARSG